MYNERQEMFKGLLHYSLFYKIWKKKKKKIVFFSRFLVKRTVLKSITVLLSSNSYTEPWKLYL